MVIRYLKIGFSILYRQRSYSLLNITGLALGIAVFVFIYLYVQSDFRYDRHWTNDDDIYRLTTEYNLNGQTELVALTPFALSQNLYDSLPEILKTTKIFFTDPSDVNDMSTLIYNDEVYEVPDITLGDSNVFKVFDFTFTEGNANNCLDKPNSMVISTEVKNMIFGEQKALGKKLKTHIREYTITGVFDKKEHPTHLNFDALASINSLSEENRNVLSSDWFWMNCYTYIKLDENTDIVDFNFNLNNFLEKKISDFVKREDITAKGYMHFSLEEIKHVHFNTELLYDNPGNIDKMYLWVFAIIAAFILLTASINYVNLATARSLKRAREIGVFKVLGATKNQLTLQYISESLILTTLAFFIALALVELLMPQFNALVGKNLTLVGSLFSANGIGFGLILILMILVLSFLSGIFPVFVLNYLQPANVLKGNKVLVGKDGESIYSSASLRKLLVTIQYTVAIGMIISTIIIGRQMYFLKNSNLGFDSKNIMVINLPQDTAYLQRADSFLTELKYNRHIKMLSVCGNLPAYTTGRRMFYTEDSANIKSLNYFIVGSGFFKLLKIPLSEGSFFSEDTANNTAPKFIINQTAADSLGDDNESLIGTMLNSTTGEKGEIIGVVNDFNFSSLYNDVEPLVITMSNRWARYILLKIDDDSEVQVIEHVSRVWDKHNSSQYLHYTFLDDKIKSLYAGDYKMMSLFTYFSIFVVLISSLGLFGLSSFLIEQRTKELGIRKVLGGSANDILFLLSKDYLKLVFLAGIIASPIVYLLMNQWLNTFARHIHVSGWEFAISIIMALLIALATVFIRARKVITEKPSRSLSWE